MLPMLGCIKSFELKHISNNHNKIIMYDYVHFMHTNVYLMQVEEYESCTNRKRDRVSLIN